MGDPKLHTQLKYKCSCGNTIFELRGDANVHVVAISGEITSKCGRCGATKTLMSGHGEIRVDKSGDITVTT